MLFAMSSKKNPLKPFKKRKISTFLKFKNVKPGSIQYNEIVYKIKFINNNLVNLFYIGNIYDIEKKHESEQKIMILQNKDNELFLVPMSEGKKVIKSRIYGKFDYRIFLHYIPIMETYIGHNDSNNEALFIIENEIREFKAIGENIENMTFEGYKLNFIKTLKPKDEKNLFEEKEIEEINKSNYNFSEENFEDLI